MSSIFKVIEEHQMALCIIFLLILLVCIIFMIRELTNRRRKKKELEQAAEAKLRDEKLNKAILNDCPGTGGVKEVYVPYDVDYANTGSGKDGTQKAKEGQSHLMVQLVERTKLSTRKFMLNPARTIRIGSNLRENDISVLEQGISPFQCEIFSMGEKVYVRNLSDENPTVLRRKKEQVLVDKKGLRLLSDDIIILGEVSYRITIKD